MQSQANQSDISLSFEQEEFNRIYTNELKKKEKEQELLQRQKNSSGMQDGKHKDGETNERVLDGLAVDDDDDVKEEPVEREKKQPSWYIYDLCQTLVLDTTRFDTYVLNLPIFKKKQEILNSIMKNQVVLVTGQTGCGKSTQVPRLLYEYIMETKLEAKIICVQPRRLAVKNLHKLLSDQIPEKGAVGYHIAMQTFIRENTKILFMTNGIFLQRLVHGTEFFTEYPFIILDQVHERDIDTDFILLSVKRLLRMHPKLRIILMSATIDNKLFQYYFAEDEIDSFMHRENFYKRYIKIEQQEAAKFRQEEMIEDDDGYRIERVGQEDEVFKKMEMDYLNSKYPCPTINVTEKGKFKKQYYYLDSLNRFLKGSHQMRYGSVNFVHKYPAANKELFQDACVLLEEIMSMAPKDRSGESVLVFLPGLGQIQSLTSEICIYFGKRTSEMEIVKCHSSILNDETTKKLHTMYKDKFKFIIATNIAESSITVIGVKYVIDFCLSKEINFNQKSRMENLQLVWASKASCEQRAGRTGRVCNGIVFRMVEQQFYSKLADYSTPEIQRSSLDKLILRIKLIHENQNGKMFQDPGQVLGTAIQPPNLKHIDQAIKSLILCGGLRVEQDKLLLTKLGRIYVDIPLDIIYCKMLIFSMLMGTYDDILILICIISQNKNSFKKYAIERNPLEYIEMMTNPERCDFIALVNAFRNRERQSRRNQRNPTKIELDTYYETKLLIQDVSRRIRQRNFAKKIYPDETKQDHQEKFKMTIAFGFLSQLIRVRPMIYDDRQEKRYKLMKKQGVSVRNTVILLNSDSIRRSPDQNQSADNRLKQNWLRSISVNLRIKPQNLSMTLGSGLSYLHFKQQTDLNKLLFVKFIQKKGSYQGPGMHSGSELNKLLLHLGDVDYMEQGNPCELHRDHRVVIDSYSSNRVVAVNKENQSFQFPVYRLLITNSITQHNSKFSCRFTSLLPDIANLDAILHLVFYPFVLLVPDRKRTRYDSIYLKKKTKLQLNYELSDQEIQGANQIRGTIKDLMNLTLFLEDEVDFDVTQPLRVTEDGRVIEDAEQIQGESNVEVEVQIQDKELKKQQSHQSIRNEERIKKMRNFWPLLKQFIIKERRPVVQEEKWQEIYFKDKQISQKFPNIKHQREQQREYMNEIKTFGLQFSYFSSNYQGTTSRQQRIKNYQEWKLQKYKSVLQLESLVKDHDPYIICSTCKLKIARLNKIGPLTQQYFRQMFEHIDGNVVRLVYNELGDYFCSMLMTIYLDKQYDVYGCKNGHYLALKFRDEKKLKLLTFSGISILYTDGTIEEQPEFQALEFKKWRERAQQSKISKMKRPLTAAENYCFVCGDRFKNGKQVQAHVKNQYHEANVRDFKSTINLGKKVSDIEKEFNR